MGIGLEIQRDAVGPEQSGAVQEETEISELEWARRHIRDSGSPDDLVTDSMKEVQNRYGKVRVERYAKKTGKLVKRKTELSGFVVTIFSGPKNRKNGLALMPGSGVPDTADGTTGDDSVCPLTGWKDDDCRNLLWMINELQYRFDELEKRVEELQVSGVSV